MTRISLGRQRQKEEVNEWIIFLFFLQFRSLHSCYLQIEERERKKREIIFKLNDI